MNIGILILYGLWLFACFPTFFSIFANVTDFFSRRLAFVGALMRVAILRLWQCLELHSGSCEEKKLRLFSSSNRL